MGISPLPPDEPQGPPPPPPPPAADVEGSSCPRCGAPYETAQEYCLNCGLRLPPSRGVIATLATAWTRRLPWYPGDWIWPVLLALLIAGLGTAVAILYATDDTDRGVLIATTDVGTATEGATPVPTEEPPPPPPPPPTGQLVEWPLGQNGYTVVLASLPTSAGRAAATKKAKEASLSGLPEVGVLDSSEYSSLHPGYYVVFSGIYNTLADARQAADDARATGYPQAYSRQIAS